MTRLKPTLRTLALLTPLPFLAASASAGEVVFSPASTPSASLQGPDFSRIFQAAEVKWVGSFDMDFKNSVGDLEAQAFQISAFLSQPVSFGSGWSFIPQFAYEAMLLSTNGPIPSLLVGDQDLHEIELSLYFLRFTSDSPWAYGAWINPSLATDFQGVDENDFFLDAAAGVGYRFSDRLLAGVGVAATNLTGATFWYPGIGFIWQPSDSTTVALYGANFIATHDVTPGWKVGVEVRPNGGIWNVDTALGSMNIDYANFRAGLTSSHQLTGSLWLNYGAGVTFGGTFNGTTPDGSKIVQNQLDDLESGFYGFVGLNLKTW